jgi:hypothetical protein
MPYTCLGSVLSSRKPCFRGQPCIHAGYTRESPYLRTGCAHTSWAGGGSRSDALGAGRRCLTPQVGGGSWSSPARGGARLGVVCEREGSRRAGRRHVSPRCRVGHAWTLGLVRRQVALSGSSLRWQFGALGCSCMESWWITESFLTMRTLRVSRS